MDVERTNDFMDCEGYLPGEVSPSLAAAALRSGGYEVAVASHAPRMSALRVRAVGDDPEEWTTVAVHRPDAGSPRATETLVVSDRFGYGPGVLAILVGRFGGRWRESCEGSVPFNDAGTVEVTGFSPSEVLEDAVSRLIGPAAAEALVALVEERPHEAEELADAIREHVASMAGPRP